jgi:protein-tyrosine phosphatase
MFQITAMSITKEAGKELQKVACTMIEKGFCDFVATDAHSTGRRSPILSRGHKEVQDRFGKEVAHTIFFENPAAILQSIKE